MRRILFVLVLLVLSSFLFAQEQFVALTEGKTGTVFVPELISSNLHTTVVEFSIDGFYLLDVNTHKGEEVIVDVPRASRNLSAGDPDLVKLTASIRIPDLSHMIVNVLEAEYQEFYDVEIAPSKGNLSRSIHPDDVPFVYGEAYDKDEFFPGELATIDDPYIIRDVRGLALHTHPFQYNPVTKTLRVYSKIVVELTEGLGQVVNPMLNSKNSNIIDSEFQHVYSSHFLNYNVTKNPLLEPELGTILVISHGAYLDAMAPYVEWKNQIGHPTYIYDVATVGTTAAQIKNLVQNYYDNNNLTYLLLVGDGDGPTPVPSFAVSVSTGNGHSDNTYSYLGGTDHYPDIFVGRFSAENVGHVNTQVQRTLEYEKGETLVNNWLNVAMGVARNEGSGAGHDGGQSDCVHMDVIRNVLLNYNYNTVHQDYDQSCAGVANTSAAQMSNRINAGVGLINYCNHGSYTGWSVANYAANHVNALTNVGKLPFIWTVACINGAFVGRTCFAETWLRATHNGEPSGALATNMSTVNQSWHPPMDAQDRFNEVLTGMIANNVKRTFTGIAVQGYYHMNDLNGAGGRDMTDTWTTFGDPSIKVRTDNPLPMVINHINEVLIGTTQIIVECDVEDAYIALTINNVIIGAGFVSGGQAVITVNELQNAGDEVLVVATAYNRIPAYGTIGVIEILEPPVADFVGVPTNILEGESVSFTCLSDFAQQRDWTFGDGGTSTEENPVYTYNTAGTYTVSLTVTNTIDSNAEIKDNYITVSPNTNPPVVDFVADQTNVPVGTTVNFTDLTQNLINTWEWEFEGGTPAISADQHPSVTYNTPGTYDVYLKVTNDFGEDDELKVGYIVVVIPDYCDAYAEQMDEYISNVTFNTINNNSGWDGGYSDFTNIETTVMQGEEYQISITNEEYYSLDEVYVWIDYNMNGSFEDPGELVFHGQETGTTTGNPHTWTENVLIPGSTSIGATRMRVRLNYNGSVGGSVPNSTPCGAATYGEVEDYTVILSASDLPPVANFSAVSPEPCENMVQFNDESMFAETWLWDFGDGNTSNEQNPLHSYIQSGLYTVSLTVYNAYGDDTETKIDYISIDLPEAPVTNGDEACGESEMTLTASGGGILQWYDAPSLGNLINTGTSYTNTFASTTTYYVQSIVETQNTLSGGKPDNSDPGGNFNGAAEHGLIFNAETDFLLKSVLVYSAAAGNRTITLYDSNDNVIESVTVNIPNGESRIDLNINIPQGNGYTLTGPESPNLFRNGDPGAPDLPYPYVTPGVLNIYSNTAEGLTDTYLTYYYYFYDWEIEVTESCASARIPVSATIHPEPTVDLGDDVVQCGGSVVLDAGAGFISYIWNGTPGDQTYEVNSTETVNLTVVDNNSCEGGDVVNVTIHPEVFANVNTTDETTSGANDGTATAVASGGISPFAYLWNTGADTESITNLAAGTYSVTITDDNGCEAYASGVVNEGDVLAPVANFEANITEGCDMLTVQFTDLSTNGPTSWLWDFGDGNTSTEQNPEHTYLSHGLYTVSLTATNSGGSDDIEFIGYILVGETPVLALSMTEESEPGAEDGTATVTVTSSYPYTVAWNTGADTETITNLVGGMYCVTVINTEFSCPAEDCIEVTTGDAPPVANFEANITEGCDMLTVQFTDLSANGPTSWLWNFGDGNNSTDQNPEHTFTSHGLYTVSLTVTNGGGSDDVVFTDYILVGETPVLALSMTEESEPGAEDGTATVTVTSSYPYTVAWNTGADTETITNLVGGTYCVTVINTEFSCPASDCIEVSTGEAPVGPVAEFEADLTAGCHDFTVIFTDLSENNPTTWYWEFGDGGTSTEQNPVYMYITPGLYTVSLTATNSVDSDVMIKTDYIFVGETPQISLSMTEETYPGTSDGTATVNVSLSGTYTIEWSTGATTSEIIGLSAGEYCVTVTSDNDACSVIACIDVTAGESPEPGPVANFTSNHTNGCNMLTVQFTDLSENNPSSWLWEFGNGMISMLQNPLYTYNAPGVYTVKLTVTSDYGTDVIEIEDYITVGETPEFNLTITNASGESVADGSAEIEIIAGVEPHTIIWSTGDNGTYIDELLPGYYSVVVMDAYDCMNSEAFEISFSTDITDVLFSVNIYPNPANSTVYIELANFIAERIEICDVLGKTIMTVNPVSEKFAIDISDLSEGVYFVRIWDGEHDITKKLIVR